MPIRGRVLDLQGKPVAGRTLTPQRVQAAADRETRRLAGEAEGGRRPGESPHGRPTPAAKSPRPASWRRSRPTLEGRFTLERRRPRAAGRASRRRADHRDVRDSGHDPGDRRHPHRIRPGQRQARLPRLPRGDTSISPPSRRSRSKASSPTAKPASRLPKAIVRSTFPFRIETVTDAAWPVHASRPRAGRASARGIAAGRRVQLAAANEGRPHNNQQPVTVDFALTRGVWLEGTVTNLRTKKPVAGASLYYYPLRRRHSRPCGGRPARVRGPSRADRRRGQVPHRRRAGTGSRSRYMLPAVPTSTPRDVRCRAIRSSGRTRASACGGPDSISTRSTPWQSSNSIRRSRRPTR